MAKITIRAKVKIDQADYDKIMEFSQRDNSEANMALRDLGKLIETQITFNLEGIIGQIAAIEARRVTDIGTAVKLIGPDGKPLVAPGNDESQN